MLRIPAWGVSIEFKATFAQSFPELYILCFDDSEFIVTSFVIKAVVLLMHFLRAKIITLKRTFYRLQYSTCLQMQDCSQIVTCFLVIFPVQFLFLCGFEHLCLNLLIHLNWGLIWDMFKSQALMGGDNDDEGVEKILTFCCDYSFWMEVKCLNLY